MENLGWNFVSTGGGDADGLNNSMIEHFAGNYNYFLAREIIQNSLDAKSKKGKGPVKVVFKIEFFTKADFPGYDELKNIFVKAKDFWKENKQALEFLNSAEQCLGQSKIPFLRISDFNTTGLDGSDNEMTGGWFNLVKSTGASFKNEGEGGSFGIGKGAPFAASDIRAVFYSTTNERGFSVFQGKAELVSHKDSDGDVRRGVGCFGIGQRSIRNPQQIPNKFWRKEQGTDIIIAGYKVSQNWVDDLLKSVLRNFWYAIYCEDLEVVVEGKTVSKANLEDLLIEFFSTEPFKDYIKPTGNPLQFYLAVVRGEEMGEGRSLAILGQCKFHFKLIEAHMNYVAMLRRSHMVIYSRRFNFPGNFAGVFICDNETGNQELRKMEPPAHNDWEPERNKERGLVIIDEITFFIRKCLEKAKETKSFGVLEIPDLEKYLPFDEGEQGGNSAGGNHYTGKEGDIETSKLIQRTEKLHSYATISPYKVSIVNENGGEDGWKPKGKKGGKGGKNGTGERKKMNLSSRCFITKANGNKLSYRLIVRYDKSIKCGLKLSAVGEEGSESIKILEAKDSEGNDCFPTGNKIQNVQLKKDVANSFNVLIESSFKIALKVDAYVVQ
jgi:hypothetical protein